MPVNDNPITIPCVDVHFDAGQLKDKVQFWKSITSDPVILQMVSGCKIELDDTPFQLESPQPYTFTVTKAKITAELLACLLSKSLKLLMRLRLPPSSQIFSLGTYQIAQ